MNTKYIYNQKEKCVQIERTYQLNLNITKVKHIGFEVTDGCNLACTYCAYGKYYNDYDIRRNEKIDFKKATLFLDFLLDNGDVREGDVTHPAGFDELPEVELRGLRQAVGGGGVDLLGADPETFAFHLSGLQEVFRYGIGTGYGGLEQLGRDHSLVPQQVPVRLFQPVAEGGKAVVFFDRPDFPFRTIPVPGLATDACRDSRFLPVNADPAEDGGRAVRSDLVAVDVE